jgi:hypothetical protein
LAHLNPRGCCVFNSEADDMQPEGLSESSRRSKRSGDLRIWVSRFAPWRGASSDTGEA